MQKVYQRINWENEPSTKSPINDDNLNKMDYAIDQIDNRVVQLSGYEDRVSQSEKSTKVSEINAKSSEINAKESEVKAKEYMESAFKGTPEGYQEFLDKVDALEIKTTKERTNKGTKHGGFRLTKMLANTEQKQLSGKNLVPMSWFDGMIANGSVNTYDGNTHTITLSGNAPSDAEGRYSSLHHIGEVGKTYTISVDIRGTVGKRVYFEMCNTRYEVVLSETYTRYSLPFVRTENAYLCFYTYATANGGLGAGEYMQFDNIQIELGETATPFEEYCGGMPSPNPSFPQPLLSTGDCVDMIQGTFKDATGLPYPENKTWLATKNPIPCEIGDEICITLEKPNGMYIYYYDDNNKFINYGALTATDDTKTKYKWTVSSSTPPAKFNFTLGSNSGPVLTPDTIGKITITINGKYLGCAKTRPKNLIPKFKGMSGNANVQLTDWINVKPNTDYTLSFGDNSLVGTWYVVGSKDGTFLAREFSTDMQYTFNSGENNMIYLQVNNTPEITNGVTIPKLNKSAQLELGTVATEIVPCGESIAWYTTQYPMIKGSTLYRENGLIKVKHTMKSVSNSAEYLYDVEYAYNNVKYFCFIKPTDYMGNGNYGVYDVMSDKYIFDWHGNYGNNMDTTELIGKVISGADPNRFWVGYPIGTTLAEVKTSGLFEVMYLLATPIIETLDTASQIALNGLETFDGVTYVEFDTRVQPLEFEAEVGTSQVGAYTLKSLNNSESNAVRYNELAVALVSL